MVPQHMKNSFEIKKYIFILDFRVVPRNEYSHAIIDSDALTIFGAQSWHAELSNGVTYVYVAHLEQKLFEFEI